MAEQPQIIVETVAPSNSAYGSRNDQNMRACFPSSPIYGGDGGPSSNGPPLTNEERKNLFQDAVLDGTVVGGNGLNSFSRDYVGSTQNPVPILEDVVVGAGGLPASPYGPNLTSPGPGSLNAADQPEFTGTLPDLDSNVEFGSGLGGTTSPSDTSELIAQQSLGNYISGKSYEGSS
jgi:hypothetical protein